MTESFTDLIGSMIAMRDREAEELRRLMAEPGMLLVATVLTDRLFRALQVLCNYSHVVSENGKVWPILDLDRVVCDAVCEEFKTMTGHDYKPSVLRTVEYRDKTKETL